MPFSMIDLPPPYSPTQDWVAFLDEMKAMAPSPERDRAIAYANEQLAEATRQAKAEPPAIG